MGSPQGKLEISIERDGNGNVKKVITGPEKLNKKNLERISKSQLDYQVATTVHGADIVFGNSSMGGGFGLPPNTMVQEPKYYVENNIGEFHYKTLSQLTRFERKNIGLTGDFYKQLKSKAKKDKKNVENIRKGLAKIQEKSKPVQYIGQETEFQVKDGKCIPIKVNQRMLHTENNKVKLNEIFSKEKCLQIAISYQKHQGVINTCDKAVRDIHMDMYARSLNITSGMQSGGGMNGMGFGSIFNALQTQYTGCVNTFGDSITNKSKAKKDASVNQDG